MYTQKVTVNLISATGDPSLCFNVIHKKWSGCTAHMLPEVIDADQTGFIQGDKYETFAPCLWYNGLYYIKRFTRNTE